VGVLVLIVEEGRLGSNITYEKADPDVEKNEKLCKRQNG